jgi:hypothetical protein
MSKTILAPIARLIIFAHSSRFILIGPIRDLRAIRIVGLGILVIADDECDAAIQFADLVAIEQLSQAMPIARDQKCNWDLSSSKACQLNPEASARGVNACRNCNSSKSKSRSDHFDAHEKETQFRILVLVDVENIAAVRKQKFAIGAYRSVAIGGVQQ